MDEDLNLLWCHREFPSVLKENGALISTSQLPDPWTILPNVTNHLPTNTVPHSRQLKSSLKLLWEPVFH